MYLDISQNPQENTCARVSFLIKSQAEARVSFLIKLQAETCNFIKGEALTLVFSCEFLQKFLRTSVLADADVTWRVQH